MNVVLVIAGGSGARTGQEIPKQFLTVNDKPIIIYTLENIQKIELINEIVVVVSSGWENFLLSYAKQFGISKLKNIILGGKTRHESINNGIKYIKSEFKDDDIVAILDANRPLVPKNVFEKAIRETQNSKNFTIAVDSCFDSMYFSKDGIEVNKQVDRNTLFKGQAPECGLVGEVAQLYSLAEENNIYNQATTELCITFGKKVKMVKGSPRSFKITTKEDIELFKALLSVQMNNLI